MNRRIRRLKSRRNRFPSGVDVIPGLPLTPGIVELLNETPESERPYLGQPGQMSNFIDWLRTIPTDSKSRLPRYMEAVWRERTDLQKAFPEVAKGELRWFSWWAQLWGRFECPSFRLFGHIPPPQRTLSAEGRQNNGVDVIGFFRAEHGIGEAARLLVDALRSVDVPLSALSYVNTESRQDHQFQSDEVGRYRVVIKAINAELNAPLEDSFGKSFFDNTYSIGQWFWELEVAPPWYRDAYRFVDELWAPTQFIADMLKREAPERIHIEHMPLPLRIPSLRADVSKKDLNLHDRFMFLFTFDFMSVMKRKNPLGLVEAYKRAFPLQDGPMLVLKSINAGSRPKGSKELAEAVALRDDIVWIDEYFDKDKTNALMNVCDCYVSLHRSEGLGLTIAEAMLLEKPVIATGYSGNTDFMTEATSFMVPWERVRVGKGAEAYPHKAYWAEPNLDVAAEMMRNVFQDPRIGKEMGVRARNDLENRFSATKTGERMKQRLEEIWSFLE